KWITFNHTMKHFCKRSNNYTLDPAERDEISSFEREEERKFIEAILPTLPIQIAKEAIANHRRRDLSDIEFALAIEEAFFFQGNAGSKNASGFEHVFVGEQKDEGEKPDKSPTELGGYHFWYKYFLDDGGKNSTMEFSDRISYGKSEYDNDQGILVPEVITLSYTWEAPEFDNNGNPTGKKQLLNKPIGGFWVGCSPEGLVALSMVKLLVGRSNAIINNAEYELRLFTLSNNSASIRTFFPKFLGISVRRDGATPGGGDGSNTGGGDSSDRGTGSSRLKKDFVAEEQPEFKGDLIHIAAALINPSGDETGKETITLFNASSESVNLENWQIIAPNGFVFMLTDTIIEPGDFLPLRMIANSPQFRNKGGTIALLDANDTVQSRVKYTSDQSVQEDIFISF
ncbi:lamin tail domain-containing protein, partial [Crocosphaera sp. Alani8]|uniref:lamin tail domain-containing protein n=1 Tax=Crocosphaera sp. Alani8 TaxID=3038952 RepID=UPI00313BD2E3